MVLVFFDPMGQALCTRMLNVVGMMVSRAVCKAHFFSPLSTDAITSGGAVVLQGRHNHHPLSPPPTESLQNEHGSNTRKIKFYLSKADEAGSSQDRQKVIVQICQNLFQRPAFRNVAIDLQTICIPRDDEADVGFFSDNSNVQTHALRLPLANPPSTLVPSRAVAAQIGRFQPD